MTLFKDLTAADVHQPTSLGNDFAPRRRRQLSEDEAAAFQAYGQGPEHERLRDLYDSQLRGNPHSPKAAFAAAWMWMARKGKRRFEPRKLAKLHLSRGM
jgi:hypothetical protein